MRAMRKRDFSPPSLHLGLSSLFCFNKEFFAIERQPNGRMVQQKLCHLINWTRLLLGFDAALICAGTLYFACRSSFQPRLALLDHFSDCQIINRQSGQYLPCLLRRFCLDKINALEPLSHRQAQQYSPMSCELRQCHDCTLSVTHFQ